MTVRITFEFDDMPDQDVNDLARYMLSVAQRIKLVGHAGHALYPQLELSRFADKFPGCHGWVADNDGRPVKNW